MMSRLCQLNRLHHDSVYLFPCTHSLRLVTVTGLLTCPAVQNPNAHLPGQHPLVAKTLTKDHKPEDPEETRQIERLGECQRRVFAVLCSVCRWVYCEMRCRKYRCVLSCNMALVQCVFIFPGLVHTYCHLVYEIVIFLGFRVLSL